MGGGATLQLANEMKVRGSSDMLVREPPSTAAGVYSSYSP